MREGLTRPTPLLEGNHLRSKGFHLLGLLNEILVSEDLLFFRGSFGVYCIANGRVGDAAKLVDHLD